MCGEQAASTLTAAFNGCLEAAQGIYNRRPSDEKNGCGPLKFPIGTK
jgi:hypothetical protein